MFPSTLLLFRLGSQIQQKLHCRKRRQQTHKQKDDDPVVFLHSEHITQFGTFFANST